ncbi:MAG TPA: hypothetical protein PKH19_03265, partial [Candidatus Syntrophosphaera sp.]|nr:hypothetical protein [Candidatus Syntrophosphaera sp.]
EYLYPQYELAKLEEVRDLPSFDILDRPSLAGLRSKPKRAVLVSVVTFAAFLLACLAAVILENLLVVHRDKTERILSLFRRRKQSGEQTGT